MQINAHSSFLEMKTCNWETDVICATLVLYMWVGSRNCGCLVAWFCYQFMAKPGSRTAAVPWTDPYVFIVYMTHRLSVYIWYGHTNDALILVTSYLHIHFSYVHECILTALYCAVFVLLMHVFLWLSLLFFYCTLSEMTRIKMINQSVWIFANAAIVFHCTSRWQSCHGNKQSGIATDLQLIVENQW